MCAAGPRTIEELRNNYRRFDRLRCTGGVGSSVRGQGEEDARLSGAQRWSFPAGFLAY